MRIYTSPKEMIDRIATLEQQNAELVAALEIAVKLNSFREFNDHIPAMKESIAKVKQP